MTPSDKPLAADIETLGLPKQDISNLLDKDIYEYIKKNGLY